MTVLVLGASGQIGHFLLPRLRSRNESVLALSRCSREDSGGVHWLIGALPDAPLPAPEVDVIYSLGPLTAFVEWLARAELPGSPRVVAMSSLSVLSKRESPDPSEQAMVAALASAEEQLTAVCARRRLEWTLLRSTLIYGAGSDRSLSPIARLAMRWRVFPLPRGRGWRQPVHADDLAQAALAAADRPESAGRIIAVGGGERLRASEMFARVRRALPVWTLPLPMPGPALSLMARLVPARAAMIGRLETDLVADNADAERLLGIHPRDFQPRW